jgi:hypothetical protein
LVAYLLHAQKLEKDFEVLDLQYIPNANNTVIDELSTNASTWAPVSEGVFERWLQQLTAWPAESGEGASVTLAFRIIKSSPS